MAILPLPKIELLPRQAPRTWGHILRTWVHILLSGIHPCRASFREVSVYRCFGVSASAVLFFYSDTLSLRDPVTSFPRARAIPLASSPLSPPPPTIRKLAPERAIVKREKGGIACAGLPQRCNDREEGPSKSPKGEETRRDARRKAGGIINFEF